MQKCRGVRPFGHWRRKDRARSLFAALSKRRRTYVDRGEKLRSDECERQAVVVWLFELYPSCSTNGRFAVIGGYLCNTDQEVQRKGVVFTCVGQKV